MHQSINENDEMWHFCVFQVTLNPLDDTCVDIMQPVHKNIYKWSAMRDDINISVEVRVV